VRREAWVTRLIEYSKPLAAWQRNAARRRVSTHPQLQRGNRETGVFPKNLPFQICNIPAMRDLFCISWNCVQVQRNGLAKCPLMIVDTTLHSSNPFFYPKKIFFFLTGTEETSYPHVCGEMKVQNESTKDPKGNSNLARERRLHF